MKKVLLCIPTLGTGGAEKFVVDLAAKLDKTAFDVTVAVTRVYRDSNFKTLLQDNGIRIVDLSGANYFQMLRKQLAYLKREKPDVVHTNIGSVLHMMLATSLMKIPVKLFTMHNQAEYLFRPGKNQKLVYQLAFTLFGYRPVAVCDNVRESVLNAFKLNPREVKTVNNGVDLSRFTPDQDRKRDECVRIINTGTMYHVKNQQAIIEAFGELYGKYPFLRLTILGDGELRQSLEQQVSERNLTEVVHMPGIQKNVWEYLRQADIYVSASKTEGLPLSILEAMACGLPVVATDAGGTVDVIKDGQNGVLVPKGDVRALCEALEKMVCDAAFRKQCAEASGRVVEQWSIERCVKGYEALYEGRG